MGYIYQIQNKTNGKLYIGQTDNIEERWKGHRKASSNCRYLKHAFKKYGFENFEFKVLIICFDDDMNAYEVEYIHKCNTLVPNGYNLREGGNSGKHHEETKKKISATLKLRNCSKPQVGRPHTDESKKKISNALKGRPLNEKTLKSLQDSAQQNRRVVIQEDLQGRLVQKFASCVEASSYFEVSKAAISMVCNGKRHTLKGFKLKYEIQ